MSLGYDVKESKVTLDRHLYPEFYDAYSVEEIYGHRLRDEVEVEPSYMNIESKEVESFKQLTEPPGGPMDSAWPMYCHDTRHTGRSPYNTASNPGFEKWWFKTWKGFVEGSGAIDNDEVIYFGSWNHGKDNFFALYPNGTLKWKYNIRGSVESTGPAIDENGIIYVGTAHNTANGDRLFAFYPNGTVKWTYFTGEWIYGSPVIGNDSTIYFGSAGGYPWYGYIYALYPNGTLKWRYKTNDVLRSDPAIGFDGTIYCGCHDGKLYALYPNNGTLKWKFDTGDWVARGPCIADDGTIIFGSWDGHLYACYPNGTLKWKTGVLASTTPVIGNDGTIYVGEDYLSAINPDDGSIKWQYTPPGVIRGGNPCVSADGIIYCGTDGPGYLVAVNPDGSERWRKYIRDCRFAPIIGEDGTVYVGSSNQEFNGWGYILVGYLHAFNDLESDAPSAPSINGPDEGKPDTEYEFTFSATSPLVSDLLYFVDWGDRSNSGWIGPYNSSDEVKLSHSWKKEDGFIVRCKVKDINDLWGPWSDFSINIKPRTRATINSYWLRFFDMFPILQKILCYIL